MSKHSKSCQTKAYFTNFERARVKGHGTEKLRIGHDSMKPFDACSITLEPVIIPVTDRQGHLYSKNAIFQHVLDQKQLYQSQLKSYHKQQEAFAKEKEMMKQKEFEKKVKSFNERELDITTKIDNNNKKPSTKLSTETLNSYWLPELAPEAKADVIPKPSKILKSPFGFPIKLKELVYLNLTPLPDLDDPSFSKTGRYMCPLCKKCLNNVNGVCCITGCGHVFCTTCYSTILKKDMICPLSNLPFTEDEILNLEAEGSSFAARSGSNLISTTKNPVARYG